ncbi:MAG: efflux RND transporter permease subunit [Firmicutes bacterium]|jgi:multidrug efflux pump subunit AcrB|nr:efflux RND transporter permease subunit [Bacillota bacterium]
MINWSVHHRSIVILICSVLLLGGILVYDDMERQENPNVVAPVATVKCIYPGASPEDVEKLIVKPLEDKIKEIAEIKTLETFSMDSVGVMKITLKDLSDSKINKVWDEVKDDVDKVKVDFPSDAWEPEVDTDLTETYGMFITISSRDYSYEVLDEYGSELEKIIEDVDGVAGVDVDGEVKDEIQINLDMTKLKQFDISAEMIGKYIAARNINIPGGNLELGKIKVPLQITGEYKSIDELKNTIVGMSDMGNTIRLKDVASVEKALEKKNIFLNSNGEKSILVAVKYVDGQNMVKTARNIRKEVESYKNTLPDGVNVSTITDQGEYVNIAIKSFESNLLMAIALVFIVVLISMGIRSALIVSSSIPLIIMTTFLIMKVMGVQLHQVSIASLIISLSLLVANGIVSNDSMYLHLSRGEDRDSACVKGVEEVKIAILTSTLTTIASFLPLAMMKGVAGKFVRMLPILVSVALVLSYIASVTLIPALGYSFLRVKEKKKSNYKIVNSIKSVFKLEERAGRFMNWYHDSLSRVLNKPKAVVAVALVALLLSGLLVPSLGVQLFPFVEREQYIIDVTVKDGSIVENTEHIVGQIEEYLLEDETVESYMVKVGDGVYKFFPSFMPNNQATNEAQFVVNGKVAEMKRIQNELDSNILGARIELKQLELAEPVGLPIQIRVTGSDIDTLKTEAEKIKNILDSIPEGKNVQDDYGFDSYKMVLNVNEEKANMMGITNYDIAKTVRMAINGVEVSKLKQKDINKDDYKILMQIPTESKKTENILDEIFITSQVTGENISISEVATVENKFSLNKILRRNGERTITIGMYPKEGYNTAAVMKVVQEKMKDYEVPNGYKMVFGGENENRTDAFKSLVVPTIIAVVVIYLILVVQFGDLRKPLIIMGTIPLSFIGVIVGLKITGYPIGFMALLGAISLMGVVVNNGIVLLDYIEVMRDKTSTLKEAIVEASTTRLRPIMIGMLTTVIGLIPMGITGGNLWAPMAYSIIFGMILSSFLTLYVIPTAYLLVESEDSVVKKMVKFLASK